MLTPNKGSNYRIPEAFKFAAIPAEEVTYREKKENSEKPESIVETHWIPDPPNNTPPGKIPAQVEALSAAIAAWYKANPSKGNKERKCSTPTCETLITPGATSGYCRVCFARYKKKWREAAKSGKTKQKVTSYFFN